MAWFDPDDLLPAAGQGALALQCRADDLQALAALAELDDEPTRSEVDAERQVVALLDADCHSPLGVYARHQDAGLSVAWACGETGGVPPVRRAAVHGTPDRLPGLLRAAITGASRA
jgi:hydroxymethylbilane synthase